MPKFIGHREHVENLELSTAVNKKSLIKLSFSQKRLLPQNEVYYVLDTSDRGSAGSYAKRWNRWYATRETILNCPASTPAMRQAAFNA